MAEELVQLNLASEDHGVILMACPKCNSLEVGQHWVDTHEVMHCICITCNYEWVE